MKQDLQITLAKTKAATTILSQLSSSEKTNVLMSLKKFLQDQKTEIFKANQKDIFAAKNTGKNEAFIDRLTFTDKNFVSMLSQVTQIAHLDDSLGEIMEKRTIADGVLLEKIRVPLGVIGIIYESRPNVTIDVFALCFKTGNACVLKGGSDAIHSNRVLINCIEKALKKHGITSDIIAFLDTTDINVGS